MSQYNISDNLFVNDTIYGHNTSLKVRTNTIEQVTNDRIYDLDVEFNEYNISPVDNEIIFIRGDMNTSIINARMIMKGSPIELSGSTITINIKEGNNYPITAICNDVDTNTSIVTVSLSPEVVDEKSISTFEFVIMKGEKVLTSQQYRYKVYDSIGEGDIGSDVEMSALQTLIGNVQQLEQDLTFEVTADDITDIIGMVDGL